MKVVVSGADGQLGHALRATRPDWARTVVFASRTQLDITAPEPSPLLDATTTLINAAAYTNVDAAQRHPEAAVRVNAVAPGRLARQVGHMVQVSTDYVFGPDVPTRPLRPTDPARGPLTVYGVSKLAGERAVLDAGGAVVRTSWVYSGACLPHRDFVSTILAAAAQHPQLRVVNDQTGSPTFVFDLARAVWQEAFRREPGVRHAAGAGQATWAQLAAAALEEVGRDPAQVVPVSTAEYGNPTPRPRWSVLASDYQLPHWRDGLHRALHPSA